MFRINNITVNQNEVLLKGNGVQIGTDRSGALLLLTLLLREYNNGGLITTGRDTEIYEKRIREFLGEQPTGEKIGV